MSIVNDVRSSSYDAAGARPEGYTGTPDEVLAQIRAEPDEVRVVNSNGNRAALLRFLNLPEEASKVEAQGVWVTKLAGFEDQVI
jgi:hypothetical protein